jgi:hypothetical protein
MSISTILIIILLSIIFIIFIGFAYVCNEVVKSMKT